MKVRYLIWPAILTAGIILLAGCQMAGRMGPASGQATEGESSMPAMGPGSGMMARHHAAIPDEYAGLTNPVPPDEESVRRGAEIYAAQCATCHGETGLGDGPAGSNLEPQPAPIAHTSRMLGDDYLFWRISDGGASPPFNSAMPAWKSTLDEAARWDVINYLRSLSGALSAPAAFDPQAEAEKRATMLARAMDEGLITEQEAALFDAVHAQMDELLSAAGPGQVGMMASNQTDIVATLIEQGAISEAEAEAFNEIHDRLLAAGLMQ